MDEVNHIPEKNNSEQIGVPYDCVKKAERLGLKQIGWEELKHALVNDKGEAPYMLYI